HTDYSGTNGAIYFYDNALDTQSRDSTGNLSTDHRSWLINTQRLGSFDGSSDSNFSDAGLLSRTGTVTATDHRTNTTLVDSYQETDVYHREDAGLNVDGTSYLKVSNGSSPSTTEDVQIVDQSYANGQLTSDEVTTRSTFAGDSQQ